MVHTGRCCLLVGVSLLALPEEAGSSSGNTCLRDPDAKRVVLESVQLMHSYVHKTAKGCASVQHDVYQRFSGYAARHRLGLFCESVMAVLDSLLESSVKGICNDAEKPKEDLAEPVLKLREVVLELDSMLQDLNAYGDGSLLQGVENHLNEMAVKIQMAIEDGGQTMPSIAVASADLISQLLQYVFEQLSEAVTYNVARLGVGGAYNASGGLTRFLGALDGFPSSAPLELVRPSDVCKQVQNIYRSSQAFDPVADPRGWMSQDVSGFEVARPSPQKLLFTISKMLPLSYTLASVSPRSQSGSQELTSEYKKMFAETGGTSAAPTDWSSQTGLSIQPNCSGTGLSYSPPHCLFELGWGSMMFSLSTEPPFDGVLAVSEMSHRGHERRPKPFVQPVANGTPSLEELVDAADRVYKSLNTPSPDVFFLSPMVGNCLTMRRLGPSRRDKASSGTPEATEAAPQLTPKLIWVPVNPLIPPPWELAPNFSAWHRQWLQAIQAKSSKSDSDPLGDVETEGEAVWWFAQCSLSSASSIMEEQGYTLLHLEHSFAVFVLKVAWRAVSSLLRPATADPNTLSEAALPPPELASISLYDHWLKGWHCSPAAHTLFGLELAEGAADLGKLHNRSVPVELQQAALCNFIRAHKIPLAGGSRQCDTPGQEVSVLSQRRDGQSWRSWELQDLLEERGKAYLLESKGRGRCLPDLGFCECFPPFRGRFCESEEPGIKDNTRPYRAVLHYLVGDRPKLLADFERTLPILWETFNSREDYPVVVFHDGLSKSSRKRILEASKNRIWFAYVPDYKKVPAFLKGRMELELGGYSIGYRGMCRFRSGPMFMQPVMKNFDYAWTLDTDGYFPAEIKSDPFERMWREGKVYGYSHVSRDQASAVQHFWEFCRLYIESKGLDPKRTKMMRRITDALVLRDTYWHEWNRVLFMNDIEVVKLSWFRDEAYQDFFNFLDSVGGFWLYRWGDHAVRTIAVAMFLDPELLMRMRVPYGHQNTCRCGDERPDEVCVRSSPSDWWRCILQSEVANVPQGTIVASGEVETVKEEILFGGT